MSFLLSLWLNLIHLLTSFFDSISCSPFPLQSKHKEDTSATHPIVLDEPELEVRFLIHQSAIRFWFPYSPKKDYFDLHISFLLFFLSSGISPNLFLYIVLLLRSFLSPWAHPWRAFLVGLSLQHLPLLQACMEFLLRLLPLLLSWYP